MAIIEKPSGSSEIYSSPEEAIERGSSVMTIPISDFVTSLNRPEVQAIHESALALDGVKSEPLRADQIS